MKIFCKFPSVNISKCNFELVICIPKDLIQTTLKAIFCNLRFQIFKLLYLCQISISIHQWKVYLFSFQMMYKSQKCTLMTGFTYEYISNNLNMMKKVNIFYHSFQKVKPIYYID